VAERNDTVSLLYVNLLKTGAHRALPCDCLRELIAAHISSAARSIRIRRELERIVRAFSAAAIPVVLLKGAALATTVYEDFTLRPMGDIDVLVQPRSLDRARESLLAVGYRPDASQEPVEWYRKNHHHDQPLHSVDHHVTIELHFHIVPPNCPFTIPIDELWNLALPIRIGDCPALVLSPEHLVLHSSIHLCTINRVKGQLRGLIDIAAILRRFHSSFRWPMLVELASRSAAAADVYHSLMLAAEYAGAELPSEVLRELRSALKCGGFERRVSSRIFRSAVVDQEERFFPFELIQEACKTLLTDKSLLQNLCMMSSYVFRKYVSTARVRCRLPAPFLIFYLILIHPTMLFRKRMAS